MCNSTFLNLENSRQNLTKKPTGCITIVHFHSHHPLNCKEGIIYSRALRYNMIISEDYTLQEELNNLTHILLAHVQPLYLVCKNIKKPSSTPAVTRYLNGHYTQKQIFSPLSLTSQTQENHSQLPSIRIGTQLLMVPRFSLSSHLNLYLPIQNLAAFTTILSTLHKHVAHHNTISKIATHINLHRPIPANTPTVATLFFFLPLTTPLNRYW